MTSGNYTPDQERILRQVKKRLEELFPSWPKCYKCKTEMCSVIKEDGNPFYQCMTCLHKEYNI